MGSAQSIGRAVLVAVAAGLIVQILIARSPTVRRLTQGS